MVVNMKVKIFKFYLEKSIDIMFNNNYVFKHIKQ